MERCLSGRKCRSRKAVGRKASRVRIPPSPPIKKIFFKIVFPMTVKNKTVGSLPVFAAIAGNCVVTILKFAAFFFSGSSAMFSEGIHSIADSANQILLAVGLRRSKKQPDDDFLYGYGNERFFWAVISACSIFFLGAGVTIYKGINSLLNTHEVHFNYFTVMVLAVSFVIESTTLYLAIRELRAHYPGKSAKEIFEDGDPSTLAVLLEDSVALVGVLIAFLSLGLSYVTRQLYFDAIGSIIIGVMLGTIAIVLISKNRQYLIGRAIPKEIQDEIIEILEAEPAIEKVLDFKSNTLDVGIYRIKCDIEFNGYVLLKEIYQARGTTLRNDYNDIKDDFEQFKKFCVEYADRLPRLVGKKIDDIEHLIKQRQPSIKYIDMEIN